MAVYTEISRDEIQNLLAELSLGRLISFSGVQDGLENTTYFVTAEHAQSGITDWVLTILEIDNPQQTEFSVALVDKLCHAHLPVPTFAKDRHGNAIHQIAGKKALFASKALGSHPGTHQDHTNIAPISTATPIRIDHCRVVGNFLGSMHQQTRAFPLQHNNPYGLTWAKSAVVKLGPILSSDELVLIDGQLSRQQQFREQLKGMPRGPIHADLFRDNTLFDGATLSAVIDFQSACTDWLLLDVAIALNDWASKADGEIDEDLATSMLAAYANQRPFVVVERKYWQDVLCFAAMQFWLSRLLTRHGMTLSGAHAELTGRSGKDPEQYARILKSRIRTVNPLLA